MAAAVPAEISKALAAGVMPDGLSADVKPLHLLLNARPW